MKKLNSAVKILIGLILGLIVGLVIGPKAAVLAPLGNIFLKGIKMLVVPLVMCSIISSVSDMKDLKIMGRIGGKTVALYVITTMSAAVLAIIIGNIMHLGQGISIIESAEVTAEAPTLFGILENIVPSNVFAAMANFETLPCIVFSIIFGIAIVLAGDAGEPVKKSIDSAAQVLFKMVGIVVKFAPIGVFALIASGIGQNGSQIFAALGIMIGINYICCFLMLLIYAILIKCFTKISLGTYIKAASKVFITAFSTRSSAATLPVNIQTTIEDLGVDEDLARFTLPIGCTINMNGNAISMALAAVLASYIFGSPLSLGQMFIAIVIATISSIGMPGVPNSGMVFNTLLFTTLGFPAGSLIAMIASVESLYDMVDTGINTVGDLTCACIVNESEKKYLAERKTGK